MDPKALSHLDPKQREAYDRVMGTAADVHSDTATPPAVDPSAPTDSGVSSSESTPFDINVGGLSSSPTPDASASLGSSMPFTPAGTPDPSPSIFTNSATTPDPTTIAPATPPTEPASFFTSSPVPSPSQPSEPELASPEAFPPVQAEQNPTFVSDNLSSVTPVTPYDPSASENAATAPAQPYSSEPLPSPAEVNNAAPKETSALLRVLYIVGAAVFFAIYTIFWVKVFNLPFIF